MTDNNNLAKGDLSPLPFSPGKIMKRRMKDIHVRKKAIKIYMKENRFSMDRRKSGDVGFNENFPALTWTAVESGKNELKLHLFVDKSSVEAFGDGGRFAMTNQVFPSEPYNHIDFYSKGGAYKVDSFIVYRLKQ